MNKELVALLDQVNAKKAEVKALHAEKKYEEAKAAKEELIQLDAKFQTELENYKIVADLEEEKIENNVKEEKEVKNITPNKPDAIKDFANAAREGFKISAKLSEGVPADGGYAVPQDILTQIEKYREAKKSLRDLVTVKPVSTNKGQRTFKKRSQQTGFTKVGESGKIGGKNTPQFEVMSYEIDKYAGYFPVTNELLADSDQSIASTLIEWIGDESRVTQNKLILEALGGVAKTPLASIDDFKKALNVTLGQAFKATSKIVTNDDGLQYLDTLKDSDGKYLLQPNPQDPMQLRLCAGATTVPVEVYPNADMPTVANKIPFIIGDLQEAVVLWDRQAMNIRVSDLAAIGDLNAFEEDLTIYRAIEREDVTLRDSAAVVYGEVAVTP